MTFRRLTRADFPLLAAWLASPPVARWWHHEWTAEALERDFGPTVDGVEPGEDWLAMLDGEPFGLVQRSRVAAYAENLADFSSLTEVPEGAATLDYLVGDPTRLGQGLGSAMISAMVERTWQDLPDTPAILVSVVAANLASWRAVEKAGFRRVAQGDLTPDNPVDDPLHYLLRVNRPLPT
ncbi:GNAT family N-acetyltransferase [Nostocoides sp. HKS02]|nr:GNAT family N-acetyltransferase [Tetrasphaera sp. HKS02]